MISHGLTGEHASTFVNFVFTPQGKTLIAPPVKTTRDNPVWLTKWEAQISDAVSYHDPWGLLTMAPDGDMMLFDTTPAGIWRSARWGTVVAMIFPQKGWDHFL